VGQLLYLREPLIIHFGGQANLFDSGRRQIKAALAMAKADLSSLPECKNILLAAQKQLLELPLKFSCLRHLVCSFCIFTLKMASFSDNLARLTFVRHLWLFSSVVQLT
jgi:hypothetical protein